MANEQNSDHKGGNPSCHADESRYSASPRSIPSIGYEIWASKPAASRASHHHPTLAVAALSQPETTAVSTRAPCAIPTGLERRSGDPDPKLVTAMAMAMHIARQKNQPLQHNIRHFMHFITSKHRPRPGCGLRQANDGLRCHLLSSLIPCERAHGARSFLHPAWLPTSKRQYSRHHKRQNQPCTSPLAGGVQRLSSLPALDTDCWPIAWAALRWERGRCIAGGIAQSVWGIVMLAIAEPQSKNEQQSLAMSNLRDTTGFWPRVRSCDGIGLALHSHHIKQTQPAGGVWEPGCRQPPRQGQQATQIKGTRSNMQTVFWTEYPFGTSLQRTTGTTAATSLPYNTEYISNVRLMKTPWPLSTYQSAPGLPSRLVCTPVYDFLKSQSQVEDAFDNVSNPIFGSDQPQINHTVVAPYSQSQFFRFWDLSKGLSTFLTALPRADGFGSGGAACANTLISLLPKKGLLPEVETVVNGLDQNALNQQLCSNGCFVLKSGLQTLPDKANPRRIHRTQLFQNTRTEEKHPMVNAVSVYIGSTIIECCGRGIKPSWKLSDWLNPRTPRHTHEGSLGHVTDVSCDRAIDGWLEESKAKGKQQQSSSAWFLQPKAWESLGWTFESCSLPSHSSTDSRGYVKYLSLRRSRTLFRTRTRMRYLNSVRIGLKGVGVSAADGIAALAHNSTFACLPLLPSRRLPDPPYCLGWLLDRNFGGGEGAWTGSRKDKQGSAITSGLPWLLLSWPTPQSPLHENIVCPSIHLIRRHTRQTHHQLDTRHAHTRTLAYELEPELQQPVAEPYAPLQLCDTPPFAFVTGVPFPVKMSRSHDMLDKAAGICRINGAFLGRGREHERWISPINNKMLNREIRELEIFKSRLLTDDEGWSSKRFRKIQDSRYNFLGVIAVLPFTTSGTLILKVGGICRILNPSPVYHVPSLNLLRSGNDGQPGQRPLRTRVGTRPPVPTPGLVDGGLFFIYDLSAARALQATMKGLGWEVYPVSISIIRRRRARPPFGQFHLHYVHHNRPGPGWEPTSSRGAQCFSHLFHSSSCILVTFFLVQTPIHAVLLAHPQVPPRASIISPLPAKGNATEAILGPGPDWGVGTDGVVLRPWSRWAIPSSFLFLIDGLLQGIKHPWAVRFFLSSPVQFTLLYYGYLTSTSLPTNLLSVKVSTFQCAQITVLICPIWPVAGSSSSSSSTLLSHFLFWHHICAPLPVKLPAQDLFPSSKIYKRTAIPPCIYLQHHRPSSHSSCLLIHGWDHLTITSASFYRFYFFTPLSVVDEQ
ncbi:uncharacterized protein CLUP02_03060 [Colletotrichum lupini]|uniref:Uncharacterized protein n=1 Tax=Colletotrichum lupini TaxID=145971 RepID=A0A9Q8SIM5_9PEZI|nr:uncharacterized protein CLUP02_03060 [Colletotrichum lupini]UQC77591.1 hypothetical protein CLUP02_03060 [Colletotrichum lupini]